MTPEQHQATLAEYDVRIKSAMDELATLVVSKIKFAHPGLVDDDTEAFSVAVRSIASRVAPVSV